MAPEYLVDVRRRIRSILLEMAPKVDVDAVSPTTSLMDGLGYHSLALLELAFALEDAFDLDEISAEETRNVHTVADVEDLIVRHVVR